MTRYSPEEAASIIRAFTLLSEKGFPVNTEIFDAWCGACVTVPIELAVLRVSNADNPEVLLTYREDKFHHGWHIPGTILLPGDTEKSALDRLAEREIGARVVKTVFVDRIHRSVKESPRGQETSLLFVSFLKDASSYSETGRFFPLREPPIDVLAVHKKLLQMVLDWYWHKC